MFRVSNVLYITEIDLMIYISARYSDPLPPPLSIFSVLMLIRELLLSSLYFRYAFASNFGLVTAR